LFLAGPCSACQSPSKSISLSVAQ